MPFTLHVLVRVMYNKTNKKKSLDLVMPPKKSIEVSFVIPRMISKLVDFLFLSFVCLASWPCWKPGAAHYHGLVSGLQKISVSMYNMPVVVFLDTVHALLAMIAES